MIVLVGRFNEEKALVGIVKTDCCQWIVCNTKLYPAHLDVALSSMRLWWVLLRPVLAARSPVSSSRPFLCQGSLARSLVSCQHSDHDGQCRALPDLALPVPHHLAGGVAVHAAAEGRHAAPGHLGGVGQHPGAVCNKEALYSIGILGIAYRPIYPPSSPAGVAIRPAAQSAIELSF